VQPLFRLNVGWLSALAARWATGRRRAFTQGWVPGDGGLRGGQRERALAPFVSHWRPFFDAIEIFKPPASARSGRYASDKHVFVGMGGVHSRITCDFPWWLLRGGRNE